MTTYRLSGYLPGCGVAHPEHPDIMDFMDTVAADLDLNGVCAGTLVQSGKS
jgi:hypothetical protein